MVITLLDATSDAFTGPTKGSRTIGAQVSGIWGRVSRLVEHRFLQLQPVSSAGAGRPREGRRGPGRRKFVSGPGTPRRKRVHLGRTRKGPMPGQYFEPDRNTRSHL